MLGGFHGAFLEMCTVSHYDIKPDCLVSIDISWNKVFLVSYLGFG